MRNTLAISTVALMLGALATPSEAQNFGGNGGQRGFNGPSQGNIGNRSFSQRSFQGPSRNFESRSFQGSGSSGNRFGNNGSNDNRRFRSVQPPSPGNQVGNAGNAGNRRTFGVQPPAPGSIGNAGNGATPRTFGVQPPAPGNIGNAGNGAAPRTFGVQPPAAGNIGNAGNGAAPRTFGVQPPAPGNIGNAGNGAAPRTFGVQPPAPGNVAGNGGNRSIQSVGPPPAGTTQRSAQPPIGTSIRPPLASPVIPSATTTAAIATVGAVAATSAVAASSASASPAPTSTSVAVTNDTAIVGQPIGPSSAPVTAATSDLPPLEMLASIGEPIMPLNQAPSAAAVVAQADRQSGPTVSRVVRRVVVEEACNVPSHRGSSHGGWYGYRRW